jgi:Protein of unknown function (DUF1549)/Protein of unknown function (DUF1553)
MTRPATLVAVALLAGPAAADSLVTQRINEEITARLRAVNVAPAGRGDDATLGRRISLDLLGRPPTAAEADAFLADPAADKVHRLIDRLRLYPEAAAHWRGVLADWLRVGNERDAARGYLARAVAENVGWDAVVRDLLDPDPDDFRKPGAADYLAGFLDRKDERAGREAAAVAVASALFGAQIQCARCHDHPQVPEWTRAKFDGLFAVFRDTSVSTSGGRRVLRDNAAAAKGTGPTFLDGTPLTGPGGPRARLAAYALRPDVPHFKRAAVNRVWRQLLGRGLVEPVDMIHAGNPASHPELFAFLADDFAAHGYNFDRLLASILHSDAYLRSARWPGPADQRPAPELFAVAELRPLSGAQMAWALTVATGYVNDLKRVVRQTGVVARGPGLPLEIRDGWESTAPYQKVAGTFRGMGGSGTTAGHAIHLAFDPFVQQLLEKREGRTVADLAGETDDEAVTAAAYLAVLSRRPTADEVTLVREHLKGAKTRLAGCQDLVWALLAGAEFRFNH